MSSSSSNVSSSKLQSGIPVRLPFGSHPELKFDQDVAETSKLHGHYTDASSLHAECANPNDTLIITSQPSTHIDATLENTPDGWSECMMTVSAKRFILSTPGFPAPLERPKVTTHCIRETPRTGLGMFATRPIKAGEFIMSERAMIIQPGAIYTDANFLRPSANRTEQLQSVLASAEQTLRHLYDRMEPENQKAYMELANSHEDDGSGPLLGRRRTNGFQITFGDEPEYSGVFNQLSRLNRSCGPNTNRGFDVKTFSMKLYAMRDVEEGEELFVSYCEVMQPTAQRQQELAPYGFKCACRHCLDPQSDTRRRRIPKKFDSSIWGRRINEWIPKRSLPNDYLVPETEEALRVMELEGLQDCAYYGSTLLHMCAIYTAIGDDEVKAKLTKYKAKLLRIWMGQNLARRILLCTEPWSRHSTRQGRAVHRGAVPRTYAAVTGAKKATVVEILKQTLRRLGQPN